MIDIVSVGKQKVSYKNHSDIQFESLSFYLDLAKKAISKFGGMFSNTLTKEMLRSEDAISNVANCIMMADWRWDEDRKGKTGLKKTPYSYRNQCAIWAIKSYLSRKKTKKPKSIDIYMNNNDSDICLLDIFHKDNQDPLELIINQEETSAVKSYLSALLSIDANILTDRQIQYIKLYYFEDQTFAEIGKTFGITREAVRQGIKKALEKIKNMATSS